MTAPARILAAHSPVGTLMALALLVTIGCDAVTPTAIRTASATSSPPIAAATPAPSVAQAVPVPTATRSPASTPTLQRLAFAMSLDRKGDYVSQYTLEWASGPASR